MILLDTSFIIDLYKGADSAKPLVNELRGKSLATTTISLFEVLTGLCHRRLKEEERSFSRFFSTVRLLGLDKPAAEQAGKIMGELMRLGKQVNALDVLIAGVGVANNVEAIVTKDEDFLDIAKVADLAVMTY
jgi:predicted nucleic acid-binding protein